MTSSGKDALQGELHTAYEGSIPDGRRQEAIAQQQPLCPLLIAAACEREKHFVIERTSRSLVGQTAVVFVGRGDRGSWICPL